jgi:hypothetical protein
MYAVRWNALLDILVEITIEQADRERSGHLWGQATIDKLNALVDHTAIAIEGGTPQRVSARSKAGKRGPQASPKPNKK